MPISLGDLFYDPDSDLFVPKEKELLDQTRIAHPFSATIQPISPDPAGIPLSSIYPLSTLTDEIDWNELIRAIVAWKVQRFHLAQVETLSLSDLHTIFNAIHEANIHLILSLGDSPAAPDIDLPAPSRIHVPVSHSSSPKRLDLLGQLTVAGHSVRALTILDLNDRELLPEFGSELAVRGIQEWMISPPLGSPDAHWLFDPSYPEPSFIAQLKEQFPWMRIEHACFPVREGSLLVQSDGAVFTTDPVTANRIFLGWLKGMSLADLLAHPLFNQTLHLMSWLHRPDGPQATATLPHFFPEADPENEGPLPVQDTNEDEGPFDAFASYDRRDWKDVKKLISQLKTAGVRLWVDKLNLSPGVSWRSEIDGILDRIPVMVLIIGETGNVGIHQKMETDAFQRSMKTRPRRLIPVLLESAPDEVDLPPSLDTYNRIDFKEKDPDPFALLLWGITGRKPRHSL
jgi:TIR domain